MKGCLKVILVAAIVGKPCEQGLDVVAVEVVGEALTAEVGLTLGWEVALETSHPSHWDLPPCPLK